MLTLHRRLSLAQGASLCSVGVLFGLALLLAVPFAELLFVRILLSLASWFCLWFFSHDLAHHLVGKIFGIRFSYYYIGRSSITKLRIPVISEVLAKIPVLGIKIDSTSLAEVAPSRRGLMHASGAVSSMILPWIVVSTVYRLEPFWVGALFTLLTIGNMIFTFYFSSRVGDLYRARRVRTFESARMRDHIPM